MNRRDFSSALIVSGAAATLPFAQAAFAAPAEGRDFTRIEPPQAAGVPAGKVEVLEVVSDAGGAGPLPHFAVAGGRRARVARGGRCADRASAQGLIRPWRSRRPDRPPSSCRRG